MVDVREVQEGDIEALVADLRPADAAEIEAVCGTCDMAAAVRKSLDASLLAWAAVADGRLMCLFGVVPLTMTSDVGVPWCLGTTVVDRQGRALTRLAPTYIARMLAAFPVLANGVDARNVKAVRWIRRMGFTVRPAVVMKPGGVPLHPFGMEA